jgi:capsular polysaccharide export protein
MSVHVNSLLLSERVLLLQGPIGGFFYQFSEWLKMNEIQCFKVNLNGGDQFDSRHFEHSFNFTGPYADFSLWIESLIVTQEIDAVVCFGDCRKYHQTAKKVAAKNRIKFFAFEEGYIRPNYITFEQDGVNFFSNFLTHLQNKPIKNQDQDQELKETHNQFSLMVVQVILYYFFMFILSMKYRHYQHHRQMGVWAELYHWIWAGVRRVKNSLIEPRSFYRFIEEYQGRYFVFALQVHNDFQIRTHSEYKCMKKYIEMVIEDFALNAEQRHHLALKHHPMDRGYRNYSKLIQQLCKKHGVEGRVHYFCDIHLPTLIKHSIGFITVNSTTGIQALYHRIPVKVLGFALYNLPKLTNQRPLSKFWRNTGKVDFVYFQNFREKLVEYSQLNGAFYGESPWMQNLITSDHVVVTSREPLNDIV